MNKHSGQTAYSVFPADSYKFGAKASKPERDHNAQERLARIKAKYELEGVRRTVDAVLLVAQHNHPHVLLLQHGQSNFYKLPGGKLKPDEDEVMGLKRKLDMWLTPESELLRSPWDIGECIGTWVRPNIDTVFYPYTPPHITRPKEVRKVYLVQLPDHCYFGVPKNYTLLAVPLFELYDNFTRYGPMMASIPTMLSRLRLTCITPAAPQPADEGQRQQQAAAQGAAAGAAAGGDEYEGLGGNPHAGSGALVLSHHA